jgi:tetratricopeptide (TPR) repeat protein
VLKLLSFVALGGSLAAQLPQASRIKDDPKGAMLAFAERARALSPRSPLDARALAHVGRAYMVAGDLPAAEEAFVEAEARGPRDAETQLIIAKAWLETGKSAPALACLAKARAKAPDRYGIFADFAAALMDAGLTDAAEETFDSAIGHEPKAWARATQYGRACLRMKRQDLAAKAWARVAGLARNEENFWNEIALSLGDGGAER